MILAAFRRLAHAGSSKRRTILLRCAAGAISALGIAAFARNHLTDYLFLRTHFVMLDFDATLAGFLLDYLCVMGLFICAGYYLGRLLQKAGRNTK